MKAIHSILAGRHGRIWLLVLAAALSGEDRLRAVNYDTWVGADSGNWSDNTNWNAFGTGQFPAGQITVGLTFDDPNAPNLANTNDIVGETFDGILIEAPGYNLGGNALGLVTRLLANYPAGTATVQNGITFATPGGRIEVDNANAVLGLYGPVLLDNIALAVTNNGIVMATNIWSGVGTYSAVFSGSGVVQLANNNVNPFAGTLSVSNGASLVVGGLFSNAQFNVSGSLGGGGTLGRVALAGAHFQPGTASGPGQMTVLSNLTADAATTMSFRLQNNVPGSGYDQLVCATTNGTLSLGSCQLQLLPSGNPSPGTTYTIISKAGTGKISGTFAGWPEGSRQFLGTAFYQITYVGGPGANSVILTVTNPFAIWVGIAGSTWNTVGNWSNSIVPQQDFDVIFPPAIASTIVSNNVLTAPFNHLIFESNNYHITGIPLQILGGITDSNNEFFFNTFDRGLQLAASQTFTENGLAMQITNLMLGSNSLTLAGSGDYDLTGFSGSNGMITIASNCGAVFFGTNTFSGTVQMLGGFITINGGDSSSIAGITNYGSRLLVAGVAPSVTLLSTNASLQVGGAAGEYNLVGNLNMLAGQYGVAVNTSTQWTRLRVSGSVGITTNTSLAVGGSYIANIGDSFLLLDNAGGQPISGYLQSLPEGAVFPPLPGSGFIGPSGHWRITYAGGSGGNSIVMTAIPVPFVWDGTETSGLWSLGGDWLGGSAPGSGAGMVFPTFAAGLLVTNDLPSFTTFESIIVSNQYTFYGNPFALTGGLTLQSSAVFNPALRLAASQVWNVQNSFLVNGGVDLTNNQLNFTGGGTMVFSNNIVGTNGALFSVGGLSALTFDGTNSYSGVTRMFGGTLTCNGACFNSPIQLQQANWLVSNSVLVSNSAVAFTGGTSNVASFGGSLINGSLAVTGGVFTVTASGIVSNCPTIVAGGTLSVLGVTPASPITVVGGTLTGTGVVTNVTATGGTITAGPGFGRLRTGNLSMGSGATLQLGIAGKLPGVNQDQLQVNGAVNLTNATLQLLLTDQTLNLGDTVVLIANDGGNPVNGTFAGLPEGTTFPLGLLNVKISYVGGAGNDVALTVVGLIPRATWTGAAPTNTWDSVTNWARNTPPLNGDNLYFPAGVPNLTNFNTLGATSYATLYLSGSNYLIEGSGVMLTGGIVASNSSGTNTVDSVVPGPVSVISNTAGNTLVLTGLYSNTPLNFLTFGSLEFRGEMDGGSNVVMAGTGTLHLYNTNSRFDGNFILQSGVTEAHTAAALGESSGAQSISVFSGATLVLETNGGYDQQFLLGGTVHVTSGDVQFGSENSLSASNSTYVVDAGVSLTLGGIVDGSGGLVKNGPGEMTMMQTNTYSGDTVINAGTLFVSGLSTNPPAGAVSVNPGATLSGVGPTGPIFVEQGDLAPGLKDSPGVITPHDGVSLDSSSTYRVRLNNVPDGFYDSMDVTGPVVLISPALEAVLNFLPPVGSTFTVIVNDGSEPIFGTFGGIPQNGFYTNGPAVFQVLYNGGSGNDVVLVTDHYLATGNTRVWTGAGTNAFWSTAQNWSGGAAPQSGDVLAFPPGALQLNSTNDFVTNTFFEAITLGGSNYMLNGNSVALLGGCTATNGAGTNTLAMPISILTNMTITCQQPGATLAFAGAVDSNSRTLIFGGSGTVLGLGPVIGLGSLNQSGPGVAELRSTNTYAGLTEVSGGRLRFQNSPLGQDGGGVLVTNGAVLELSATTNVTEDFSVCGTVVFTNAPVINVSGNFDFPTNCGGTFDVAGGTLASINISFSADGGEPIKQGLGDLLFLADGLQVQAYSGPAQINAGRLIFNDQSKGLSGNFGDFIVNSGGTLAATGLVNRVQINAGGTLAPGLFSGVGEIVMQRDLMFAPGGILAVDLEGVTPGSDFDAIFVTGSVNLSNATLHVALGYDAVVESQYEIISNDGSDPVLGAFAGLPEGTIFTTTNGTFQITYAGGDGNDVVLTLVNQPPFITSLVSLPDGCKQLNGTGEAGSFVLIEATESLSPPVSWEVLDAQMVDSTGQIQYTDMQATNFPVRFYRITPP